MSTKGFHAENYFWKIVFPTLAFFTRHHRFKIVAASISLGLFVAGSMITVIILRGAVGQ
jgi:hypothetical protein